MLTSLDGERMMDEFKKSFVSALVWSTVLFVGIVVVCSQQGCMQPRALMEEPQPILAVAPDTRASPAVDYASTLAWQIKTILETTNKVLDITRQQTEYVNTAATVAFSDRTDVTAENVERANTKEVLSGPGGLVLVFGLVVAAMLSVLLYLLLKRVTGGVKDSTATGQPVTNTIAEAVGGGALRKLLNVLLALWGTKA